MPTRNFAGTIDWASQGIDPQMAMRVMNIAQGSSSGSGTSSIFTPQMGANGQVGMLGGQSVYNTPQLTGWQKFGHVTDAIGAIGGLWNSIQQNKIAKESLNLQRDAYNTNMNNSIQTYNTALEGRIRAQYAMEGRGQGDVDSYLDQHKLTR